MSVINVDSRICRSADHIVAEVDDEVVLMHTVSGKFFNLTDTGRRVWDLLHENILVSSLVDRLQSEFDVGRDQCETDVIDLLSKLQHRALIRTC